MDDLLGQGDEFEDDGAQNFLFPSSLLSVFTSVRNGILVIKRKFEYTWNINCTFTATMHHFSQIHVDQ